MLSVFKFIRRNVFTGMIYKSIIPRGTSIINKTGGSFHTDSHNVTKVHRVSQDFPSCAKIKQGNMSSMLTCYCNDRYSSEHVLCHQSVGQTLTLTVMSMRSLATRTGHGHKKLPMPGAVENIPEQYIDRYHEENLINSGWLMRFANENGYLSWCRNTYLTTAVGAAMFVQTTVPYAKEAAEVILLMGGLCLCTGTFSFIFNLWVCRTRIWMGRLTVAFNTTMAVLHLILWVIGVALYLGYVEEDDELHPQPHDV